MANLLDKNTTDKIMRVFAEKFEVARTISKTVNVSLFEGEFNPSTGDRIRIKRPTDYISHRTVDGDLTGINPSPIISGTAEATVQDFFTTYIEYSSLEQALELDQLEQLMEPMAARMVSDLEIDFAKFVLRNTGLVAGDGETAVTTWQHVAEAGAVLNSHGIPKDSPWYYWVNPYTQVSLANDQRSLGSGGVSGDLIDSAFKKAMMVENFAGMSVMSSTTLSSYTSGAGADREGTLAANPDVTYATARDTMRQSLSVTGFAPNLEVKAGEIVRITGRNRLNLATRELIVDNTNNPVEFTGTVLQDVTLGAAGEGTIIISGPALFQTAENGAYNTVDSAPVMNDLVTLLGSESQVRQPNLFYHKNAFAIASVRIPKLSATDSIYQSNDGIQMRMTSDSDVIKNRNLVRVDLLPAYAVLNPFFAGQGFGTT